MPEAMGRGDVARAAWADGHGNVARTAFRQINQPVAEAGRAVSAGVGAGADPKPLARPGRQRQHAQLEGHNQLIPFPGVHQQRRGAGAGNVCHLRASPICFHSSCVPPKSSHFASGPMGGTSCCQTVLPVFFSMAMTKQRGPGPKFSRHQIAIEHRRGGITPDVRLAAEVAPPQLMAGQVVTINTGGAEPGDHAFAIRHGRGAARRIRFAALLLLRPNRSRLPQQLAVAAPETHDPAQVVFLDGLSDENLVAPNDRG